MPRNNPTPLLRFSKKCALLTFFILPFAFVLSGQGGQKNETHQTKRISILPLPAFGYEPETRAYIGAVTLFNIKLDTSKSTRTSNAKTEFNYTQNRQIILDTEWDLFFKNEKWISDGLLHFSDYPDLYYGIGKETQKEDEIGFESKRFILHADVLKKVKPFFYVGGGIKIDGYQVSTHQTVFKELKSGTRVGINIVARKDSRNHILTPQSGHYISLSNSHNYASSYFSKVLLDLRKYHQLKKFNQSVIAFRFFQSSVLGPAPFFDLSSIGGDELLRGYRFGRFRDNHLTKVQAEVRTRLIWRVGLAAFGGTGIIYRSVLGINQEAIKPNAGLGLRFLIDKKENINLRFDYAIGKDTESGFYISFGESF